MASWKDIFFGRRFGLLDGTMLIHFLSAMMRMRMIVWLWAWIVVL